MTAAGQLRQMAADIRKLAPDNRAVLGPLLWMPHDGEPYWYAIVATAGGAEQFQYTSIKLGPCAAEVAPGDPILEFGNVITINRADALTFAEATEYHAVLTTALQRQFKRLEITSSEDDQLAAIARKWPGERIDALTAAVQAERASR